MLTSFLHSEIPRTPWAILHRYHRVLFMSFAMRIYVDFVFWGCIGSQSGRGSFKKIWDVNILLDKRSFGHNCIYDYQNIKQIFLEAKTLICIIIFSFERRTLRLFITDERFKGKATNLKIAIC